MPPRLSEDEIDDLVYLARAGEDGDLGDMLRELAARDDSTPAEFLAAAREDQGKATCLHMAAANGHAKTVTLILSHLPLTARASVTAAPPAAATAATEEAGSAAATETSSSSSRSAPTSTTPPYIDAQNAFGNTALHWACLGGHLDIVKLLLSRGASPAVANDKDQIPLDLAAFNNHMHVVDHFLAQSRDIEGDNAAEAGGGLESQARALDIADEGEGEAERSGSGKPESSGG